MHWGAADQIVFPAFVAANPHPHWVELIDLMYSRDLHNTISGAMFWMIHLPDIDLPAHPNMVPSVQQYDEDGYFFITDRLKELIKVRGYQVAPAELEALVLTRDDINDAAVIQIPDEESGELPRAYVVLKDSEGGTSEDVIKAWVKERVAPFKRLEGGVFFKDVIPKSASGKSLRRLLRDEAAEESHS